LRIPPLWLVQSSDERHHHGYWPLGRPVPVTDGNREALRDLQRRWVAYVGGDLGAADLARVLRVPGTCNTKYDPPRLVQVVWFDPGTLPLYALERHLNQFAPKPKPPTPPVVTPSAARPDDPRAAAYARAALADELAKLAATQPGGRNAQLNVSALKLARLVAGGLLDANEVAGGLLRAALATGLSEREIMPTLKSGFNAGLRQPRTVPND
jgi:hypothetical protein